MPISEDLSVAYHQQDTDYYCSAACAQMVLDSIGTGLLNQNDLYNYTHSHSTTESDWYSGPDGVLWTMNNLKPPSPTFNSYFVLDALDQKIRYRERSCGLFTITRLPLLQWFMAASIRSSSEALRQA